MGCFVAGNGHRWPNKKIPFAISNDLSTAERDIVRQAISRWNTATVITLEDRDGEPNYVEFVHGSDCSSPVGMQGGKQNITCSFQSEGTVVHEIGHAVGLWHEQSRQDRDLFIIAHLENVRPGDLHNFDKHIDDGNTVGPYDYASAMHYGQRGRAVDWRPGSVIESQSSKAAPAVAAYNNQLHMVHLGSSSNDLWWSLFDGQVWKTAEGQAGNARIPGQKSKASPALAVFNGRLHMVHLGDSSNDIWWSIYDGVSWKKSDGTAGNEKIPGQKSKASPALAVFNGRLHMVHLGDSSNDIWWSIYDGVSWKKSDGTAGNEKIPGQKSKVSPSLAVFNNQFHMVHLGDSSNDIWNSTLNQTWAANRRRYNGKSRACPVMAALAAKFYMLHIADESSRIYQTLYDTAQMTLIPPAGVSIGLSALSPGDIQTVAQSYA